MKQEVFNYDYNKRTDDIEPARCLLTDIIPPKPGKKEWDIMGPDAESVLLGFC